MGNGYTPFPPERTDSGQSSLPAMVSPSGAAGGHGTPEGIVIGNPGMRYRDLDNDDLYLKITGTAETGWRLIGKWPGSGGGSSGGGTGGGGNVFASAADPSGVLSVTGPAVCIGSGAFAGTFWVKSTSGTSANDWVALIV